MDEDNQHTQQAAELEPESSTAQSSTNMATPDSQLKRKRQPRNSACQGCAALKMKCIAQPNGKCERCNRMDRDCVPAVPKPRKRRTESTVGIEGEGMSLLDFGTSPSMGPPPRFDPPRADMSSSQAEKSSLLTRHDLSHTDSKSFVSLFSQGLGNVTASEELLRGIDFNFVANSFTIFRQLTQHFPFVEILPGSDVIAMVARRPVLTLAVCTVASGATAEAQSRLSQAFQYALASKLVLGSERSMDVFLGLLVYLGWHHQYTSKSNIYQELYLLAGMAADLGLYRSRLENLDPDSALERDRAFVGCYYLSCCLAATGFDRPSPLRWTNNLRRCAENVSATGRSQFDRALVAMLELAHALDDMEEVLREESSTAQGVSIQMVDLQTKATLQRLKALKREYPSLGGSPGSAAATIHVYQRLVRASETPDYTTLIQCACAIKEYIDDILARTPSTLHHISIVDFSNLLEILMLMARISKPLPAAAGWEAGAVASMLQPESVLESMRSHMSSAPANDPLSPRHEPLLARLQQVCEGIRKHMLHEASISRGEAQNNAGGMQSGQSQHTGAGTLYEASNPLGVGVLESALWVGR